MQSSPARPTSSEPAAGLLLLAPALAALALTLVWPSLWTLWTSLQESVAFGPARFVGADSYGRVFSDVRFQHAIGLDLVLAVVVVAAAGVVPPLLALLVDAGGRQLRLAARLVLSLPLAFFAPAAGAGAWLLWLASPTGTHPLSDPARAPVVVAGIVAVTAFGIACGVGLVAFLPVLRGRDGVGLPGLASVVTWGLVVLAGAAAAVQSFVPSFVLTQGGPAGATMTPALYEFTAGFQQFDLGRGAVAATLLMAVLAVMGTIAAVIVIGSGLRVELGALQQAGSGQSPAAIVGVLLLVAVAVVSLIGGSPRLAASVSALGARSLDVPLGQVFANTVAPPLLSAFVQVLVAFVAALSIGGLRPFGARSEWLLLPFAPWLFVGVAPLALAGFEWERTAHLVGTFLALFPPVLVSVPALFVLTLCCRGQAAAAERLAAAGVPRVEAFLRAVVGPVLPMVGLLMGATALVGMQDLLWPLLAAESPNQFTLPVLMTQLVGQFASAGAGTALVVTLMALPGVVALAGLVAAQVLYLDRLQVRAG